MCVYLVVCVISCLWVCVMTRGLRMPDRCVNDCTSLPDVPTKAAICPAVLPTELTTSVSAPASNIIHVMSVLPTGTKEEESGLFKIKYLYIKRVILTWQAGEHQRRVSVLMFVTVHVGSVLQQQLAHVRFPFVRGVHERGHPILCTRQKKKRSLIGSHFSFT